MNYTKHEFYRSREWKRLREVIISERTDADGFVICDRCGKPILKKYDMILHHKVHLTDDNVNNATISLNPKNIEILHHDCHNKDHNRFGHSNYMNRSKTVYIVYGAVCFANYDYVKNIASKDDLIIDINRVYEMISINPWHDKPKRLASTAFDIHNHLLDVVKYRNGKWKDAYIVSGLPRKSDRERMKTRVKADEFIFIDKSYEECMELIGDNKEWKAFVDEWFDKYEE